jgi:hypothetical protein
VSLEGLTVMRYKGTEAVVVVSDAWVERLRARGGEQGVVEHFEQTMLRPLDGSPVVLEKVHNPGAKL